MEKLKKWFENYWYHYKWQTLIALVFILTLVIGVGQIAVEKNNYDLYVLYAGAKYLQPESHDNIVESLKAAADSASGADSDEEMDVNLQMLVYLSDDKIAALIEEYEKIGEEFTFNALENQNVLDTFMKQLVAGENVIMFLDPVLYDTAEANEALYKVKDVLGRDVPGMTDSGCGVKLTESGLIEKYPSLADLPDDSIVCFRRVTHAQTLIGKSESQQSHTFQLDTVRELFSGIGE